MLEHRGDGEQVAQLQFGVEGAQLQRATGGGIVVLGAFPAVQRQQVGARGTATAVQLHAEQGVGIEADADCPLGVAGTVEALETVGPLFAIALLAAVEQAIVAAAEVAVEVEVAVDQLERAAFDEAFRRRGVLGRHEGQAEQEQGGGGESGQNARGVRHVGDPRIVVV
ncbi:hypothetical protein D9M68_838120 [compost metagenome]